LSITKIFFADHGTDENGKPERHINLWNIFDLLIVIISIFSSFSYLAVFRVFRILRSLKATRAIRSFRIIKALKLVNALGKFRSILKGLIRAIPEILWVFLLLLLFEYVYAVIGTNFFGSEFPEYFGSLGASLLTLCQISWISGVARPIILAHPAASVYFISYWFITACVLLKVIVGIIVNSMNDERNSKVNLKKTVTHEKLSAQITALQKQIEQLENAIVTKK
jgi:voltage-gated sodium channel